MKSLTLNPVQRINGEVTLPGSKSLSNRILLLSAFSEGETLITNLLKSDDTNHMLNALKALGVHCELSDNGRTCRVKGNAGVFHTKNTLELFLGNAGTAMRPLCAALCVSEGEFVLTGEPRMLERPIGDLVDALRQCGANINYLGENAYPPIRIKGTGLQGGSIKIKGNISSQFLTALLLSAPFTSSDLDIVIDGELVSKPYIDITLDTMKLFGVFVENRNYERFIIKAGQQYVSPKEIMVEGDASSASYFLAAAAIKGGKVRVNGIGTSSVQGDVQFAEVLKKMGAKVAYGETWVEIEKHQLNAIDMDLNHIPDAAMTIATAALFAKGKTTIRNIYNWRVKETDRLSAMATELRKVGAIVEEGEDFISIEPPEHLKPAAIDTYDDHRMAMCFSLAALGDVPMTINDPACVSKTFPDYFDLFSSISS